MIRTKKLPHTGYDRRKQLWQLLTFAITTMFAVATLLLMHVSASAATTVSIYVSSQGNDDNSGLDAQHPVKTVPKGVALAAGGGEIRVAVGTYEASSLSVPPGVTITGGWENSFEPSKRTLFTLEDILTAKTGTDKCANHTCLTSTQGDRVVVMKKGASTAAQSLSQLVVFGPNLASLSDGRSSFGVVVDDAPEVHLDFVVIEAGTGAAGIAGENRTNPLAYCTQGGSGGGGGNSRGLIRDSVLGSCTSHPGKPGESVKVQGTIVAHGGEGGDTREADCRFSQSHDRDLSNGDRGGNGDNGIQGTQGHPAPTANGYFVYRNSSGGDLFWVGEQGARGSDGSHGAGGGGGGAGGSASILYWCLVGYQVLGGVGHRGADGGCGGGGGGGGSSGGGSFGLVVNNTNIASTALAVLGGPGGVGGPGGAGAPGKPGEKDENWGGEGQSTNGCNGGGPTRRAGTGGQGGYGGAGGGGGGGAGGNGGPSFPLVQIGAGKITMSGPIKPRIGGGRPGTGGAGGKGGQDSNTASGGNSGAHEDSIVLQIQQ